MADQNRNDDDQDIMEGGIEHVIHDVETGEEIPSEHPDEAYQFRQRIVNPDNPADVLSGEETSPPDVSPEPLPPAENP